MTTCAQYQTMLDDVETAIQKLALGKSVQSFGHGENHQSNVPANEAALQRRRRELQLKVDACNGVSASHRFIRTIPTDGHGHHGF
jgi:hypothetical protein